MFDEIDPFTASAAELLAQVVDLEPGPMAMSVLLMVDRSRLSGSDAITFLQVHERLTAWWASVQVDAIVAAASPEPLIEEYTLLEPRSDREVERTIRIHDAVREELSSALRLAPVTAQARIDSARLLAGPLAETGRALGLGEISTGHAAVVVEAARRLPGYLATESAAGGMPDGDEASARLARESFRVSCGMLQERVLPVARRGTLSSTRQAANRAVLAIDADGQRRRRERARCTRDVYVVDELDGISTLIARLATEQAHAIMTAIDTTAHLAKDAKGRGSGSDVASDHGSPLPRQDPTLTMGEYRAQALTDLIVGSARGWRAQAGRPAGPRTGADRRSEAGPGTQAGVGVRLDVVIPLDVLTGASDEPGEIQGGGLIAVEQLRELLADPEVDLTVRRLVSDPVSGALLDVGRRSYAVPDRLREFIVARDRTCRFPGCRRAARRCQIDHAQPWDDGGETSVANLGALCVRHHQLKTHGGWDLIESAFDGSCTWISPHGRRYPHESVPRAVAAGAPPTAGAVTGPDRDPVANMDPDPPPF